MTRVKRGKTAHRRHQAVLREARGFVGGRSLSGAWSVSSRGAVQTGANEYFAKLMIPSVALLLALTFDIISPLFNAKPKPSGS